MKLIGKQLFVLLVKIFTGRVTCISLLVEQYLEEKPGLVINYIEKAIVDKMNQSLHLKSDKGKNQGFRMML